MTKKEINSLTKDEIRVYQEIEKYVAQNGGSPNIKELAETSDLSQYKVKRVLKSLQRKGIINIKQDGASRRPEILKFIIPAFLGGTGAFVGFKILTERQMKKVAAEQQKETIPIKTLFPKSKDVADKPVETITIPERSGSREIVYIPTESGGYKPQPVNLTYVPSDFVFEGSNVNVYGGGDGGGSDFSEQWAQILTLIGNDNCAMQYKGNVESGIMSFQEVYQICAEEGADVDIHSDVGDFERMMCHAAGSYWDEDHCDRSRKPDGTPKDSGEKTTMEDVLTGTYDYDLQDEEEAETEGYNPFEQWQKDYGKDAEPKETEIATPTSPRFNPVDIGLPSSNGGKTPCASHSTEAECMANGCTWFSWTNACG